jgi:hypothetical protein
VPFRLGWPDDGKVPRWVMAAVVGAIVGAIFMVLADALTPQSQAACAAAAASDGCPSPPLFTWSAIRPLGALVGAAAGAALGVAVRAMVTRERRRRDRVGA